MFRSARFALILLPFIIATAHAQTPCPSGDAARAAMLPLALQNKLLAHTVAKDDFELDAPADVSQDIVMLRKTLDVATQAFFHCEAGNDTDPASLQSRLAAFLHAERSHQPNPDSPAAYAHPYGADLTVTISPAPSFPNSLYIDLTFGVECGDDSLLFLYTREDNQWRQRLRWYSDKYTKPSDAFGDFLLYTAAPGPDSTRPLIAVAHGTPWCTSRFSGFKMALLQPSSPGSPQKLLADIDAGYSRGDTTPTLKPYSEGVTLRLDASSRDLDNVFTYIGVFRYRTTSGSLERLPVANNARDFVDSWLNEDWPTASRWSESPTDTLKAAYERFQYHGDVNKDVPTLHYGAVPACTVSTSQFQVQLELSHWINRLQQPLPPRFAQVRQNPDSFTMLAITDKPDPACTGPDIMKKR